jgi:hypothetical protein
MPSVRGFLWVARNQEKYPAKAPKTTCKPAIIFINVFKPSSYHDDIGIFAELYLFSPSAKEMVAILTRLMTLEEIS